MGGTVTAQQSIEDQSRKGDSRLRRVTLTVRPESRFPVPTSDGYSVYSSLLGVLDGVDESVSRRVHDSPLGSLHCSGLLGPFAGSDRPHHKTLLPGETYEVTLGVVDPADEAIFQALVSALVLEGDTLPLTNGALRVESMESENATHAALVEEAGGFDDPTIEMQFRTATCIQDGPEGEVTTMFPYRSVIFNSLIGKWNRTAPSDLEFDIGREEILGGVIEKPDARTYSTHSVLVNRVTNEDGENRNIFRQGFTGDVGYAFKGASESVVNGLVAVSMFGEYSGVGSAVARGCGSVGVAIQ